MRINSTLYYILKDHLGSASVVTDASGVTVGEQRYYPYGETRVSTGTIYTDKLFTGQREITGLGVYDYGARFYSPKIGRFLSADTIGVSYANPQTLNRFGYGLNNPLIYVDPTGHLIACPDEHVCPSNPGGGSGSSGGSNSGGNGGAPASTSTPSTTPVPVPAQTPVPSNIPAYTNVTTNWEVSNYYYEYGDWDSAPYGSPMEVGISFGGGAGQFSFSILGHDISLPVLKITEEQRTVRALRIYTKVQTTATYSQTGNILSKDVKVVRQFTTLEAVFLQQKIYVFGVYIGTTTGNPVYGNAPLP